MKHILIVATLFLGLSAFAQNENSATADSASAPAPTASPAAKSAKGDIDDEITNARLRAVTGAKSRFSFWSQFIYYGAAISNPLSTQRPQLNSQNSADPTNLFGQVSGKYRITEHDSIIAGVGLQYTPSYTDNSGNQQQSSTTISSPYVDYDRAFKVAGIQNVVDVILTKYTLGQDLDNNLNWNWSISDQFMREFFESKKLSLGAFVGLNQDVYTSAGQQPGSIYLQGAVEPVLEYAFTPNASFRTIWRMYIVNEIYGTNGIWNRTQQTESMGLGYAITRDIYIYPNIQWAWGHITADSTTIGFQTNINL